MDAFESDGEFDGVEAVDFFAAAAADGDELSAVGGVGDEDDGIAGGELLAADVEEVGEDVANAGVG